MTRALTLIVVALLIILAIGFAVRTVKAEPACMTLQEARAKYPKAHLFKRRGCWGLGTEGQRRAKPAPKPAPDIVPRVAEIHAQVDANGGDTVNAFEAPRSRFITFALIDESKKTDMLPRLFAPQPTPLESDFIAPLPTPRPQSKWLAESLAGVAGAVGAILVAFIFYQGSRLLPRARLIFNGARTICHDTGNAIARFANELAAGRKRKTIGGDGQGNKQSYFPARNVHDWVGRTNESRYANNSYQVADSRNDNGAIGAWSRSRGLRPETPRWPSEPAPPAIDRDGNRPESPRWFRARLANPRTGRT